METMNKTIALSFLMIGVSLLPACARQSTPSMMNTSRIQLVPETTMEQLPVADISPGYIYRIAENYGRYGADKMHLSLAYDPADKSYGAMQAFNDLASVKGKLAEAGIRSVTAETVKTDGVKPTLLVAYDAVSAQAPAGCRNMPGFDDGLTTSEIGDYRFGCSVDTMIAKQIYRPSDLNGHAGSDPGDGRRAANSVEYYRQITPDEAEGELNRIERTDIQE
jgi:type IV pilus biogenesis protein CpaD/CtpE